MTHPAREKIAADAPNIPALRGMKAKPRMKLTNPPVKKIVRSLPGPVVFSNVFPKTNRNSILPKRCKMLAWTNSAATRVHSLPFSRLLKLKMRFPCANAGSCCHAQRLAAMQASISSELVFKESAKQWDLDF